MLDCESDNSGNHQSLLEGASVQTQLMEGEFLQCSQRRRHQGLLVGDLLLCYLNRP